MSEKDRLTAVRLMYIISAQNWRTDVGKYLLKSQLPRIFLHNCFHVKRVGLYLINGNGEVLTGDIILLIFDHILSLKENESTMEDYINTVGREVCEWQKEDKNCLDRSKVCLVGLLKYLKENPNYLPYEMNTQDFNFLDISCNNDESIKNNPSLEEIPYFEDCEHKIHVFNEHDRQIWNSFKKKK
ncbi:uncharacterized protein LOC126894162 isoform X2 [Daktulosphaira vitifoliae]|uniref:uncharacterized protein LOC126894162 isoform X2 n=1 Tax=Daktulosphaira vitifoliae TaxID=58002 RepID=UPI0021A9AF28|nr:uncharacterized protein LOC126894162 isoform X2 [Daktulosphaira vitifoliae]